MISVCSVIINISFVGWLAYDNIILFDTSVSCLEWKTYSKYSRYDGYGRFGGI